MYLLVLQQVPDFGQQNFFCRGSRRSGRCFFLCFLFLLLTDLRQLVEAPHQEEHHQSQDQEVDDGGNEVAVVQAQYIGYSKVTTKGIQGVAAKTELVETVNGKESSREVLKNEVLVEPVTQVVLTGTAVQMATPTEKANAQSAGFIMPLNSYEHISAYWGDGRNHKAIDFAGKRGQALFAV